MYSVPALRSGLGGVLWRAPLWEVYFQLITNEGVGAPQLVTPRHRRAPLALHYRFARATRPKSETKGTPFGHKSVLLALVNT